MLMLRYRGVVMGGQTGPLIITDFTPPVVEKRGEFTDRYNAHGQLPSRQRLGGRTWAWTLATNGEDLNEAVVMAAEVERAWLDRDVMDSTTPVPLEYSSDGGIEWFRVYGRPGRVSSLNLDIRSVQGVGMVDVEFVQTDPAHYYGPENTATLTALPAAIGGLAAPLTAPLVTVATGADRQGSLVNAGDLDAPVRVVFYGPSSNPILTTSRGYELTYRGAIPHDQHVEVDPVRQLVRLNSSRPVPGRLGVRSRLSDLVVPPGRTEWFYRAADITGTSRAELFWRDAYTSMQY